MTVVLIAFVLIGLAGGMALLWKRRIDAFFAPAVFAIIAILYVFALPNALVAGYRVVTVVGLAAFGVVTISCICRREARKCILSPGLVVFLAMLSVAWYAHRNQFLSTHDDFSHWALAVKATFQSGALPQLAPHTLLLYTDYPPATTLFYTYWLSLAGVFSEGYILTAANLFMLVCFLPIMESVEWKNWKTGIPLAMVCFMFPLMFHGAAYQNVYVDILLGCLTAYALIVYFLLPEGSYKQWMIGGAMLVLPLVKASGTALALTALVVMALDALCEGTQSPRVRRLLRLVLPCACLLAGKVSWRLAVRGFQVEPVWHYDGITPASLLAWLMGSGPSYRNAVLLNFGLHIANPDMMGDSGNIIHLSYVMWLLALVLFLFWARYRIQTDEKAGRYLRAGAALGVGSLLYAVALVLLYAFAFPPDEGASLLSFDRYMSSYMTAMVSVVALFAFDLLRRQPLRALPACIVLITGMMLIVNPAKLIELTITSPRVKELAEMKRSAAQAPSHVILKAGEGDKIAYVAQDRISFEYYVNHYEFCPADMRYVGGATLAANAETAEQYGKRWRTCICSPEEWVAMLKKGGFTHLYLHDVDNAFIEGFGLLFENKDEITDGTLFEIHYGNEAGIFCRVP